MTFTLPRRWLTALVSAGSSLAIVLMTTVAVLAPLDAEARRLGGGRSQGMQRTLPKQNNVDRTQNGTPAQQAPGNSAAAAPVAGGAAAAAAPRRSWMGPIAGLAAGLGIAALMSHLGLSEAFGNFLMIALLAVAAIFLVRFLMRRMAPPAAARPDGLRMAGAGAHGGSAGFGVTPPGGALQRNAYSPGVTPAAGSLAGQTGGSAPQGFGSIPADFDSEGFERIAKMIFIRLQAANDTGDLNDLRSFTTPEMYAAIRLDLQERAPGEQHTDVLKVEAEVLDVAQEADRQVVSVRFSGLVREEREAAASDFDEVWHLVKPNDDSRSWAIAGIQQQH